MPAPALLAALLAASPVPAPDAEPPFQAVTYDAQQIAAQSFGLEWQYTTIPASAFEPYGLGLNWFRNHDDGYLGSDLVIAASDFLAPLDLPNGAQISAICFLLRDTSATENITVALTRIEANIAPAPQTVATSTPNISAGYATHCLEWLLPLTYRRFGSGDFFSGFLFWEVRVTLREEYEHWVLGAYVKYRLSISPGPDTATFTDVGTGNTIFRYVEAVNAAGITNGCTATRFCPNDPVTRGQLAVYLARALGLHWPF